MPKTYQGIMPTAYYRCEGADLGTEALAEIHYRDHEGTFLQPQHLYLAKLVDRPFQTECHSFFCERCRSAYGLQTKNRLTLKEAILDRLGRAQRIGARDLLRATGN